MMLNLNARDKQSVKESFQVHPKTVGKLNGFINIKILAELTAISIDNGFPLSAIYYDQYTESEKTLSQFSADSKNLMVLKDISESIYYKIIHYISTFSKYIYSPFPVINPVHVLIKDDLSIYMDYIIAIYKALVADNEDIEKICNQKMQQLVSNNHYQIDVRFIPHKIYVTDINEDLQSFVKLLTPLNTSATVVKHKEENNFEVSTYKTRSEGLMERGQEHLIKNGLNTIEEFQFIRNLKKDKKYRRFEVIIDRNGKDTMKDNIYKFVPLNRNNIPIIALDNGPICKIINSKGIIIPGKLRAEDEGIVTISYHVSPQCIKMYLLYGCGEDHLIGSRVFPGNLRHKLNVLFHGNAVISANHVINDCHDLQLGVDELHLNSRKYFGNGDEIPAKVVISDYHVPLDYLSSKEHTPCSFESQSILYSSEPSPSPAHPIHEAIKQKLIHKLKAKGALTSENLDLAIAKVQKQYKSKLPRFDCNDSNDGENTPNPRIRYHLLPDSEEYVGNNKNDLNY
eukprot:190971_1